jgi:arabinofuranosyltransferase
MSGRFVAVPLFIAILVFVKNLKRAKAAGAVACLFLLYLVLHPLSPVKMGTPIYSPRTQHQSFIDTNLFAHGEGAALLNWRPGKFMPDHDWYYYGEEFKKVDQKVHMGGAFGGEAIGYFGFAAGPDKHIIDCVALTDTLLARLPAVRPPRMDQWKSGHFHRVLPEGYLESIMTGRNMVRDPDLNRYYEKVRSITRGPLFSWERFSAIWGMNRGLYDHLLEGTGPR